MYNPKDKFK